MSPGLRPLDGRPDGRPAVGDDEEVAVTTEPRPLRPAGDLVEDRLAVLAPRVLVGDDDEPAALGGQAAHDRPLRGVALARRPEHRDEPAAASGGDRREEVEDATERGRGVGVVDDDAERLAGVDPLHPAGDAGHRLEAPADRGRIEVPRLAEGDDRERVVDVEPAGEPELQVGLAARCRVPDAQPAGVLHDPRRVDGRRVGSAPYVTSRAPDSRTTASKSGALGSSRLTIPTRGRAAVAGTGPWLASRSNSESLAARYASNVPCSSRCSWVTLVRIAAS